MPKHKWNKLAVPVTSQNVGITIRSDPRARKQLAQAESAEGKEMTLLRYRVTDEEIAEVLSRATGIPVAKMMEGEKENSYVWKKNCTNE